MNWVPFAFGKANPIAKQEHELKELICEHIKKTRQTATAVIFVFGLKVFES